MSWGGGLYEDRDALSIQTAVLNRSMCVISRAESHTRERADGKEEELIVFFFSVRSCAVSEPYEDRGALSFQTVVLNRSICVIPSAERHTQARADGKEEDYQNFFFSVRPPSCV